MIFDSIQKFLYISISADNFDIVNEVIASKELNLPLLMNSVVNQEPNIIPLDLNNNMHRKLVMPLTHKPTRGN